MSVGPLNITLPPISASLTAHLLQMSALYCGGPQVQNIIAFFILL